MSVAAHFPISKGIFIRDADPLPRPPFTARAPVTSRRPRAPPQPRPLELGGHSLRLRAGRVQCSICMRSSANHAKFEALVCPGAAASMSGRLLHASHRCQTLGGITWCNRCGAYGAGRPVGLVAVCLGRPQSATTAHRLRKMMQGVHPRTGVPLCGPAIPAAGSSGVSAEPPRSLRIGAAALAPSSGPTSLAAADRLAALAARVERRETTAAAA